MQDRGERGRPKRKYDTKWIQPEVPLSTKQKFYDLSEAYNSLLTDLFIYLVDEEYEEYSINKKIELNFKQETQDCEEFCDAYMKIHFGENPEDETAAKNEALKAYYSFKGFDFGSDESSFILPQ